jgi:hypothetical protein
MKLLEAAKYPEQVVEGLRFCSVAPKSGIEFSERVFAFQVSLAQKPFLEIRVVPQKNIQVLRAFADMFKLGHVTACDCLVKVSIASGWEFIIVWLASGIPLKNSQGF